VLNCFVRNEPGVAATTHIASARMAPACDVALVLIRNTKCEPINFDVTSFREMENIFMTVVEEPLRTDRFEMTIRSNFSFYILDGNRFDPVNAILQHKKIAQSHHDLVWQHRIRGRGANVEKQ